MFLHADSKDCDQTGWMLGAHAILLVLSCSGSILDFILSYGAFMICIYFRSLTDIALISLKQCPNLFEAINAYFYCFRFVQFIY